MGERLMKENVIDLTDRDDISQFLTHLTKGNSKNSAKDNLISILSNQIVHSSDYCCMFNKDLKLLTKEQQKQFSVTCFTETPISRLKVIVKTLEHTSHKFEPYGIIVTKNTKCKKSKLSFNPVIYIRRPNKSLTKSFWNQFKKWEENPNENNNFPSIGCLVNHVGEGNDFQWQKEWRIQGDFCFEFSQIIAVIAPEYEHEEIKKACRNSEINQLTFIDAEWNVEDIIYQLSRRYWKLSEKVNDIFSALNSN